jgi:aarF domain-containing kinase
MAGRRLVDAAKLFNASKSIAAKHISLRSQQLDVYTKTSSLAKAVKNQTDRVTLTAQAAIALAKRVNEDAPPHASAASSPAAESRNYGRSGQGVASEQPRQDETEVRGRENGKEHLVDEAIFPGKEKLEEARSREGAFSEDPMQQLSVEPPTPESLDQAHRGDDGISPVVSDVSTIPTPSEPPHLSADAARKLEQRFGKDIPSAEYMVQSPAKDFQAETLAKGHDQDVFYVRSNETPPEPSSLPRKKIPKHTESRQESDSHVDDSHLNQDVYYSIPTPSPEKSVKELPQRVAVPEQDQVPEGINTDVFRTRKVAAMLGGNPYERKPHLDLHAASKTFRDHTKLAQGHDQDTFNVRTSEQSKPSAPENIQSEAQTATEKEMHDFASELAKDVHAAPSTVSEVCIILSSNRRVC